MILRDSKSSTQILDLSNTHVPLNYFLRAIPHIICIQIAVAKQLGLQLIRMADSMVLPLNTTHYSYELEAYLQKYIATSYMLNVLIY